MIESGRVTSVANDYKNYEISTLNLKLQDYYYQTMDSSACSIAIKQNLEFADNLYNEGLQIEKYEQANQLTSDLLIEKKRYVLLKTELWFNSILLKKKCNNPFDTIAYIYAGDPSDSSVVAQQKVLSNVLKTVKDQYGNSVILLPIAGDLNLTAVTLQMELYNITNLPVIIINENTTLYGYHSATNVESYLGKLPRNETG